MAARDYEVEVTVTSARDLKNVNWKHGPLRPYAVLWVDPEAKSSTKVDDEGDTSPYWGEARVLRLNRPIEDSTLYIDIVHASSEEDTKPLIGSARLPLRDIVDQFGFGERVERTLQLKRPSGRPHGKLDVKVCVREPRYHAPDAYYAPAYGVPPTGSRDYPAAPPFGAPYGAPPPAPYKAVSPPPGPYHADPSAGYPYYGQPSYGQQSYGQQPGYYGQESYVQPQKEKKQSKYGLGTGLAVGAVAGALGGIALVEGAEYVEDKIAEDVEDKVKDDLGYDDDDAGDYGGDDF